jgi:hypothetical protein
MGEIIWRHVVHTEGCLFFTLFAHLSKHVVICWSVSHPLTPALLPQTAHVTPQSAKLLYDHSRASDRMLNNAGCLAGCSGNRVLTSSVS